MNHVDIFWDFLFYKWVYQKMFQDIDFIDNYIRCDVITMYVMQYVSLIVCQIYKPLHIFHRHNSQVIAGL